MNCKIAIYVLKKQAKQNYSKESFDVRLNAGIMTVKDILERLGYDVGFASSATITEYDLILFSITSDCDWWEFISERVTWSKGGYKVCVGGQGVQNVKPFLPFVDYFCLGRAEGVIDKYITEICTGVDPESVNIVYSGTYSDNKTYYLKQVDEPYKHKIKLSNGQVFKEDLIGCNHRCLFCGYTWARQHSGVEVFEYGGLWSKNADVERAMLDVYNGLEVNFDKLRTTAVDGLSERLRFAVKKRITRDVVRYFLRKNVMTEKPHNVKYYNIIGYPTETEDDWEEFFEDVAIVDNEFIKRDKQAGIVLHSTPFRATPQTPLACEPMSYINYRGLLAKTIGKKYYGNLLYQGNAIWAVESMGTESLPTVIKSAIMIRGDEGDTDNIIKVAITRKFESLNTVQKQATLEKYFNVGKLFGRYKPDELPTKNIKTYANVEKAWHKEHFVNG